MDTLQSPSYITVGLVNKSADTERISKWKYVIWAVSSDIS